MPVDYSSSLINANYAVMIHASETHSNQY